MNKKYSAVIIGCGKGGEGVGGHSIGYVHGLAWQTSPRADIAGACDLNAENLRNFQEHFSVSEGDTNARALLARVRPDIVSLCTYANARRDLFAACAEAGVKGIWCEKPLALTMDDARAMQEIAEAHDIKVVVNHCRRLLPKFREIKSLLDQGVIGDPVIFLGAIEGWDQMEWGTHWHDMFRYWASDQPVEWMLGQARCDGTRQGYGHAIEEHSVAYYGFADGTCALLDGGKAHRGDQALRIVGTRGLLEIGRKGVVTLTNADGRRELPIEGGIHPGSSDWITAPHALLDWMEGGAEPGISLANSLLSTELYLACYESARIGDRVDLPLGSQPEFPLNGVSRQTASIQKQSTSK